MSKIYLINVGANTGHGSKARSPIFGDDKFIFVTFPDGSWGHGYPTYAKPYVRNVSKTHLDPNWEALTYGDCCQNPRARALLSAEPNDILLFWALLWRTSHAKTDIWESRDEGWYLIGALRIAAPILKTKENLKTVLKNNKLIFRAAKNAHVVNGCVEKRDLVRVFLGDPKHSAKFDKAVDLEIYQTDSLLRRSVLTKDGKKINWHQRPHWNSVTRGCRAILDLEIPEQRRRAKMIRDAIRKKNPYFDLLAGI
jgi:Nucleotide modification associated domain 3